MNNLSFGLKCHKVFCDRNFLCANETCAYNVKYGVQDKRYWKGHTMKPFLPNSRILDETYTCIFCKNLAFCEFRCSACIFIVIGHLPSPRYICIAMHVGLHNHLSAKGGNQEALDRMN
jgi:hypothetical protein